MEKVEKLTTVRVAHVILAHTNPEQVGRLVQALAHPSADVYIHVDKKARIEIFQSAVQRTPNCHFIRQRVDVKWGGYSMVQATLASFSEVKNTNRPYHFINLLSGADYPLRPMHQFHTFLLQNIGRSFFEYETEGSPWWEEAKFRFQRYHFPDIAIPGSYTSQKLINFLIPKRKKPKGMEVAGRSQWFTLSVEHLDEVLAYVKKTSDITRFFRYTWGSDEFFFQTILLNSKHRTRVINDNLRYIDWQERRPSPKTLTAADFTIIQSSGKFFARKFDTTASATLLDLIDENLLGAFSSEKS